MAEIKESPKSRMWAGLFSAALLADLAWFAISRHQLISKRMPLRVSPMTGVVVGGIEIALALYVLVAWSWSGYREMKAEGKEKSATQI